MFFGSYRSPRSQDVAYVSEESREILGQATSKQSELYHVGAWFLSSFLISQNTKIIAALKINWL